MIVSGVGRTAFCPSELQRLAPCVDGGARQEGRSQQVAVPAGQVTCPLPVPVPFRTLMLGMSQPLLLGKRPQPVEHSLNALCAWKHHGRESFGFIQVTY